MLLYFHKMVLIQKKPAGRMLPASGRFLIPDSSLHLEDSADL